MNSLDGYPVLVLCHSANHFIAFFAGISVDGIHFWSAVQ